MSCQRRQMLVALAAGALVVSRARAAGPALPGDSLYQLQVALTDQDGQMFELASLRGTPVLASMFYTSCDMVCPMIFETVHATLRALPAAQRRRVRVLMVSFDPARDTVPVLRQAAQAHGCDAQWTLARGDDAAVRSVAAALGVQYRRLTNETFNHSTRIALLDRDGRIAAGSGQLGAADPALVRALREVCGVSR